jgi:FlaG/FlaF family flagellin (archaellin)
MKGVSTVIAMIFIVVIVVALIALAYTFAVGVFSSILEESIQQKIIESNNETFINAFCQQQQYVINESYKCEQYDNYVETHVVDLWKDDIFDNSKGEPFMVVYSEAGCLKQIGKNIYTNDCNTTVVITYDTVESRCSFEEAVPNYKNFTIGRYYEEYVDADPSCNITYNIYCPKKFQWGIECLDTGKLNKNFSKDENMGADCYYENDTAANYNAISEWWTEGNITMEQACEITNSSCILTCNYEKSQKFIWDGENFIRGG